MSTTTLIRRGTALGLAAILGAAGLAACGSDPAVTPVSSHAKHGRSLSFVASDEPGNMAMEDLGGKSAPGGPDIGDLIAFTQALTAKGKQVGQVHVAGVGSDHTRHLTQATGTIALADGTIAVVGMVTMEAKFTLAVVGGTGAYAGESGTMDFDGSGSEQKITVHLDE